MSTDSQYEWGGISDIDVDNVDLEMYPKIAEIKYSKLRLYKGDCIFMPSGETHEVVLSSGAQVACTLPLFTNLYKSTLF